MAGVCPFSGQRFEGDSKRDTSKVKNRNIIASDSLRCTFINFYYAVDVILGVAVTDALEAVFGVHQFVLQRDDKVM